MTIYIPITPTRLYIKKCSHCDVKYFGKTTSDNVENYIGSGKKWKNHLKKHNATSIHLWNSDFYTDTSISRFALKFSRLNKIVNSDMWANLKEENGIDGGWEHVHTKEIQEKAVSKSKETLMAKYGVECSFQIPHVKNSFKKRIPWNKGIQHKEGYPEETRRKMSESAKKRKSSKETKEKISKSLLEYNNKNSIGVYLFIDGDYQETITNLKEWCDQNELEYIKVFSYFNKGPVKMIPRYDSPTRRWFVGKEIKKL